MVNLVLGFPGLLSSYLVFDVLLGSIVYFVGKFLCRIFSAVKEKQRLLSLIPSPMCPSWLYGHLPLLTSDQAGLFLRAAIIDEFPAMYCFQIGPLITAISIHHPELVKVLLNSDAHKGFIVKRLGEAIGEGLLSADGLKWQKKRHLLTPAFHFETLKAHVNVFNETVKSTMQWLEDNCSDDKPCDIHLQCSLLSFDNMTRCIMSQPGVKDGENVPLIQTMKKSQHLMIKRFRHPFLLYSATLYNLTANGRNLKSLSLQNQSIISKIINDRKNLLSKIESKVDTGKGSFKTKKNADFLDILLKSRYEDGSSLSDEEVRSEVKLFFVAGSETTGNAMTWLAYALSQNQSWQEKCRKEIIEVCGKENDNICWEDISKLRNLHLCIKETLRLYPIAPFIGRTVYSPITFVDPYDKKRVVTVKKGTTVQLCIFALHRHPDFWKNPNTFDPERFSPERSKRRPSYAYIPFSASYRNCIGQNFAMYEMKVSFAHILRKYRLLPSPDSPPPVMVPEITLKPKDHVYLKVQKV